MSNLSQTPLTNVEIEEELSSNSVGVENENVLQGMNLNEEKDVQRANQQPKEVYQDTPVSPSILDRSNFPSLPSASLTNPRTNKLKLPRKTSTNSQSLSLDADDKSDRVINLIDEDDQIKREKFCLPGFVSDNAPPLARLKRPMMLVENPYYCMKGENPDTALKRMLAHHMAWKAEYESELKRQQCINQCDKLEMKESDIDQSDIYKFKSQSPIQISKTYTNVRRSASPSTSQPARSQRRASPDSDCIEIEEPIMKPEDPKFGEWLTASGGRKSKRNCRSGKANAVENVPDVDFGFNKTWDSGSATWCEANSSAPNNRRTLPRTPVVEEEKVQCPICQRNFPQSKVETHAALCEGYSSSPMDVEEAT